MSQKPPDSQVSEVKTLDTSPESLLGPSEDAVIVDPLPDPDKIENQDVAEPPHDGHAVSDLAANIQTIAAEYVGFDPTIHATNEDGTPKFKTDGTYAKKRGRKPADHIANPLPQKSQASASTDLIAPANTVNNAPAPAPAPASIDYAAVGKMYAGMWFGMTNSLIGPEWMPTGADERKSVEGAFANWARSQEMADLPPGWALVITLGFYSMARLQHENTKSKFTKLREKVAHVILWAKHRMGK